MNNKSIWILLIVLFFIAGAAGSFFLAKKFFPADRPGPAGSLGETAKEREDSLTLRLFFLLDNSLKMEERKVPVRSRQLAVAEAVIEEYFKGPSVSKSNSIPAGVKLLGLYRDADRTLYVDLSDELRRNFQGDARTEYILLKGLSDSLLSNLQDFSDYKILVEGKELETLGGHVYLKFPLKAMISGEPRKFEEPARE